jgi:tRNA (guanine37-N1)-methyltransferase
MRIDLLTLFPDMCEAVMAESIIGRARRRGAVQICCHQIRNYAYDKHQRVDDSPFGGGMGMLMMAEPIALCLDDMTAFFIGTTCRADSRRMEPPNRKMLIPPSI